MDEIISHLALFMPRLRQIRVFGEGDTRTAAVFFIKYLRTLGFDVKNNMFAKNAWYFHNVLVRANYSNLQKGIDETTEYLELFLRNLLLGENNPLKNRTLNITYAMKNAEKVDIRDKKADIDIFFGPKTAVYVNKLYDAFSDTIFGRSDIMKETGLKESRSSELIKEMLDKKIIETVKGYGKGKYRFI